MDLTLASEKDKHVANVRRHYKISKMSCYDFTNSSFLLLSILFFYRSQFIVPTIVSRIVKTDNSKCIPTFAKILKFTSPCHQYGYLSFFTYLTLCFNLTHQFLTERLTPRCRIFISPQQSIIRFFCRKKADFQYLCSHPGII